MASGKTGKQAALAGQKAMKAKSVMPEFKLAKGEAFTKEGVTNMVKYLHNSTHIPDFERGELVKYFGIELAQKIKPYPRTVELMKKYLIACLFLIGCATPHTYKIGDCVAFESDEKDTAGKIVEIYYDYVAIRTKHNGYLRRPQYIHLIPKKWCEEAL